MNDDARRMLEAIDIINRATFTAGEQPTGTAAVRFGELHTWTKNSRSPIKLRNYQRAGISSRTVAEAINAGVLVVAIPAEGGGT